MSKRRVKQYDEEFKRSSAKLAVSDDKPITQTAKDLGINATTLHGWVNKYYPNHAATIKPELSDLERENQRLRKELARVKEERNILKKAAAYFANDQL